MGSEEICTTSPLLALSKTYGGIVKKVATKFASEKGKVTAGDAFIHAGHHLEEKYLGILKKIIKVINKQGDRQNHKTNVKAQMTEWKMYNEPGFDKLSKIILELALNASEQLISKFEFSKRFAMVVKSKVG